MCVCDTERTGGSDMSGGESRNNCFVFFSTKSFQESLGS